MELWRELILGLTDSLAWPIVVGLLALLFRHPIRNILNSIKSIRFRDLLIEIDRTVDNLQTEAQRLDGVELPEDVKEQLDTIKRDDSISAIMNSWNLASERLWSAARRNGIEVIALMGRPPVRIASALADNGVIRRELFLVFGGFRI